MSAKQNLTNKRFGRLLAIQESEKSKTGRLQWLCKCDCGTTTVVLAGNLSRGNTKSCGCLHADIVSAKLKGRIFGKLTALINVGRTKKKCVEWLCVCECGGKKVVSSDDLIKGSVKSCGCLRQKPKAVKCDYCGKETKKHKWKIKNNNKNFCGMECQYLWKSENMTGENAPGWKGGIASLPYCAIWGKKEFKDFIKSLDDYECKNTHCFGVSKRLCVHHIDYDKMNCDKENLITLCTSCNSRANKDRDQHTIFYKNIIKQRVQPNG